MICFQLIDKPNFLILSNKSLDLGNSTLKLLELLVCYADIGAVIFKSGYHLIRRNHAGVIDYCVNLPESFKTACYLFDAFQPLQG